MRGRSTKVPAEFHETFCRACIDAGASAVIGHGPHELRGIEIYHGGVIFYSIGNFLFETETTELQPSDAYADMHLPVTMQTGEYMDVRSAGGTRGFPVMPEIWEAVIPSWTIEDGRLTEVRLHPISLGMKDPRSVRGLPRLSHHESTLLRLADLSSPYGTQIDIAGGVGTVRLDEA